MARGFSGFKLLNVDKLKQLGFEISVSLHEGIKIAYADYLKIH